MYIYIYVERDICVYTLKLYLVQFFIRASRKYYIRTPLASSQAQRHNKTPAINNKTHEP